MDVKAEFLSILGEYDYPIFLQGTLESDDAYPESFFTFWNDDTIDLSYYDNLAHRCVWNFSLYFFSTDPDLVNSILLDVKKDFQSAGWFVRGRGYDAPADNPSHTGRAIDLSYIDWEDE